ncbi:uncharacterized protein LOC110844499 [Folsomia candida]|uniref:Uncharacterized protein n=1 Tax=Folsomia candida TaxID=158441 RepID=A0A226ERH2_FOLCA|nr:uncharacterized protein LOC110844499 [Folsomia candida]OXA59401.1 hypothetical protein Fcan01_04853 [Folsomia candida]
MFKRKMILIFVLLSAALLQHQVNAQGLQGNNGYSIQIKYCHQSCRGFGCQCYASSRCDNFRRTSGQDSHLLILSDQSRFCRELGYCDYAGSCSPKVDSDGGQMMRRDPNMEAMNNCNKNTNIDCIPMVPSPNNNNNMRKIPCNRNPYCQQGQCLPDGNCSRFKTFRDKEDKCDLCVRTMGGMCNEEGGVCVVKKSGSMMMI